MTRQHTHHTPHDSRSFAWLIAITVAAIPLLQGAAAPLFSPPVSATAEATFADPAFQQLWARTDSLVSDGSVQRSWYWGPQPGETRTEPYSGSPTGTHLVQYFDKGRMEINNPDGDRGSQWFVTSGLLVAEMVSGKEQTGDKEFKRLQPAEIAIGGDGLSSDPDAPTYTSFRLVASLAGPGSNRAEKRMGQSATATIDRAGNVGDNSALGLYPGAKLAAYDDTLGHNMPQAFWDFLNRTGPVSLAGQVVEGQTLADWVFLMGYPITEPYWARVKIGGVYSDVLFQMFERRTLAYIPSMQKGWQVQLGNVGVHYHRWVYGGPLPAPVIKLTTPTPGAPVLPDPVDAVLQPVTATVGTSLNISMTGFRPGEEIVSWLTAPDGSAMDAHINIQASLDGTASGIAISTTGLKVGQWAITFHGKAGNHEAIAYFYLYPPDPNAPTATATPAKVPSATITPLRTPGSPVIPTATRTRVPPSPQPPQGSITPTPSEPVVPTQPPTGLIVSVQPPYGAPTDQYVFSAGGLQAGEHLQVKFTDPNLAIVYPAGSNNGQYQADASGRLSIMLVPAQAFPSAPTGTWLFEVDGLQSNLQGVTGFVLR